MDVCHIFLGRPWKYDINVVHDERKNTYTLDKNGRMHMLLPIEYVITITITLEIRV